MKRFLSFSAAVILFSACGSAGSSAPSATLPAGATVITALPSLRFDAKTYGPVSAGEITFGYQNDDTIRHTLIISKDGVKVPNFKLVITEKGSIDSGTVVLEAGEYQLMCDIPGHGTMKATITVE